MKPFYVPSSVQTRGIRKSCKLFWVNLHIIFDISTLNKKTAERQFCPHGVVAETNWYDKKITCPSPLGLEFTLVPSADRANVVYRDLHGCHCSYFEAIIAFVVGLVSLISRHQILSTYTTSDTLLRII